MPRLHCFYFHDPPILYPPNLPVPGEKVQHLEVVSEGTAVDATTTILPGYMGQTFTTMCRFWAIVQEITVAFFGPDGKPISGRVPLAFAEAKYQKLLAWADTMGEGMALGEHSPAHVIISQYGYHLHTYTHTLNKNHFLFLTALCVNICH